VELKSPKIEFKIEIPKRFYDLGRQIILDLGADIKKTDEYQTVSLLKRFYDTEKKKDEPGIKIVILSDPGTYQPYLALINIEEKAPELDLNCKENPIRSFDDVVNEGIDNQAKLVQIEATDPEKRDAAEIEALPELRIKRHKILGSKGRLHKELERIEGMIELPESASQVTLEKIIDGKRNNKNEVEAPEENVYSEIDISGRAVSNKAGYFYHRTTDDNNKPYELRFHSKTINFDYYWYLLYALEFKEKVTIEFQDDETFKYRTNSTILNLKKIDFSFDVEKVRDWMKEASTVNDTKEIF
jgi:hypothetical protein